MTETGVEGAGELLAHIAFTAETAQFVDGGVVVAVDFTVMIAVFAVTQHIVLYGVGGAFWIEGAAPPGTFITSAVGQLAAIHPVGPCNTEEATSSPLAGGRQVTSTHGIAETSQTHFRHRFLCEWKSGAQSTK